MQENQFAVDEVPLRLRDRQQLENYLALVSKSQVECLALPNCYQRLMKN